MKKTQLDKEIEEALANRHAMKKLSDSFARQRLLWIPFVKKGDIKLASPVPVDFSKKEVSAVWTLPSYQDPNSPPKLPFHPTHGKGAFLEDHGHDWSIRGGKLIYRSRITDEPVWVLVQLN